MNDNTAAFHLAFPPVDTEVVRVLYGVPDSALPSLEVRQIVPITWTRHAESTTEVFVNGHSVQDGSTYSDYYAVGRSVDQAGEDFVGYRHLYGAAPGDKIEVVQTAWLVDTPTLGFARKSLGSDYYFLLPNGNGISPFWIEVPETGLFAMPFGSKKVLGTVMHSKTVVASSNRSGPENSAARDAFKALLGAGERVVGEVFAD